MKPKPQTFSPSWLDNNFVVEKVALGALVVFVVLL